jgi:hypothetical protein
MNKQGRPKGTKNSKPTFTYVQLAKLNRLFQSALFIPVSTKFIEQFKLPPDNENGA